MKALRFRKCIELKIHIVGSLGSSIYRIGICIINKKTPQILDIGCGTGGTTKFISKWGNVTGVEIDPIAASLAKKRGINVRIHSAQKLQFSNNHFDLVTIFDVLYHKGIEEHKVLSEAYRVLKKNGVILISDCATPSIWSKHDQIMDAKYRYTKKSLTDHISNAGFKIIHAQYIFASVFPFIALSRRIPLFNQPSQSLPKLPNYINTLFSNLLKKEATFFPSRHPFLGSSLFVIAKKTGE
jgi:ubiquinone/menaquinone biosynthesis C-methylase UbiE